jgi:hypothetical protein
MKVEPATILVVLLGSVTFFLLLLPLAVVLARVRAVWRADRGTGVVLAGVIIFTGIFFILFFVGLVLVTFTGATPE